MPQFVATAPPAGREACWLGFVNVLQQLAHILARQAKAEAEGEAKRYERQTKVSKLEQSLQKLQSELDHASNAFYRSRDEQSTFEKEAESATRHADAAREKAHHARQALKSVSAGSKDPLALYPHDVQTVHRAIRKEKRWSAFPPIGPIGLHVEPKETKW